MKKLHEKKNNVWTTADHLTFATLSFVFVSRTAQHRDSLNIICVSSFCLARASCVWQMKLFCELFSIDSVPCICRVAWSSIDDIYPRNFKWKTRAEKKGRTLYRLHNFLKKTEKEEKKEEFPILICIFYDNNHKR